MSTFVALVLCFVVVSAAPRSSQRIVGGSVTTINQYPEMASLLVAWPSWFSQECGGTILNNRAILSAAHCFRNDPPSDWRIRVGSTFANSGGTVLLTSQIILHPAYSRLTFDSDIAILRTASAVPFSNVVRPGNIASSTYNLGDNQVVWAAGWGVINYIGSSSEQLRHVQIWTINQATCASRYASMLPITDNMLCSGWLDVGGRDQCQGDSGGPLFHNGAVVGVCSWGYQCALARYPGVNTRVSRFTNWIVANA